MCSEAVTNQYPWLLVSTLFGLEIKYTLKPLEANLQVSVPGFRARIILSRGRERGLVTSISTS